MHSAKSIDTAVLLLTPEICLRLCRWDFAKASRSSRDRLARGCSGSRKLAMAPHLTTISREYIVVRFSKN